MKTNHIQMQDLKSLKEDTIAYNKRWASSGKPLAFYQCPCCYGENQTPMPTRDLVDGRGYWDSLTTCYHCGELYFIVKHPIDGDFGTAGKIFTKTLDAK